MSKKLEKNGLWESSRLMLPEHKQRILLSNRQDDRRERPVLDADKLDEIGGLLGEAFQLREQVKLLLWGPYADRTVEGVIAKFDTLQGRILIGGEWIKPTDILEVSRQE